MQQPGRSIISSIGYRFGFNGKEKDDEIKGSGNSYDFGARIYDARLGRWLSLDPMQTKYPSLTPYSFVDNSPLVFIDPDGKKFIFALGACSDCGGKGYGKSFLAILKSLGVKNVSLASARGVIGNVGGDAIEGGADMLGDQLFTLGEHADKPYTQMRKTKIKQGHGWGGADKSSYIVTGLDAADPRIKTYYDNIKKELKENPLAEGEQLNLGGVSAGSVLTAQTALALANDGIMVHNVILIGSPISKESELYKELIKNKNIGNVIFKDLEGDPIKDAGSKTFDEKKEIAKQLFDESDDGPHVQFSNDPTVRKKIADELIQEGVK